MFSNYFYLSIIENDPLSASWSFFASKTAFLLCRFTWYAGTWNIDLNNKVKVILKTTEPNTETILLIKNRKNSENNSPFISPLRIETPD